MGAVSAEPELLRADLEVLLGQRERARLRQSLARGCAPLDVPPVRMVHHGVRQPAVPDALVSCTLERALGVDGLRLGLHWEWVRGLLRAGATVHGMSSSHYIGSVWVRDQTGMVVFWHDFATDGSESPVVTFEVPAASMGNP